MPKAKCRARDSFVAPTNLGLDLWPILSVSTSFPPGELRTANLSEEIAQADIPMTGRHGGVFDSGIVLISIQYPIIVYVSQEMEGQQEANLVVVSSNSFKKIGAVKLPLDIKRRIEPKGRDFRYQGPDIFLREDPHSHNILLGAGNCVCLIPLAALKLQDEPFLAVTIEGSTEIATGRPHVLNLTTGSPKVKLKLTEGPKGMSLDGGKLTWTPADDQVGTHKVRLVAFSDKAEKNVNIDLLVRRPSVKVPFPVRDIQISPDGTQAILLSFPERVDNDPFQGRFGGAGGQRLALVDLEKLTVLAERKMPAAIGAVAIDSHHVYAAAYDTDAFYVLSRKDLSDVRRLFTTGRVTSFVPVNGQLLFVATETENVNYSSPNSSNVLADDGLDRVQAAPAYPGGAGRGGPGLASWQTRRLDPADASADRGRGLVLRRRTL